MTWSDWYRFKSYIRSALWIVPLIAILFEHVVVGEAAKEIGSSVQWIGFAVAYAISGTVLTVFGYFAMTLSQ